MAFYYDQLQMIFDLKVGHSVVLDQKHNEALLVKLAIKGFDHTFLLVKEYVLGTAHINLENLNQNNFVVCTVNDAQTNDLAKLLFYFCSGSAINILKNLSNPLPFIVTSEQSQKWIDYYASITIDANSIEKRVLPLQ